MRSPNVCADCRQQFGTRHEEDHGHPFRQWAPEAPRQIQLERGAILTLDQQHPNRWQWVVRRPTGSEPDAMLAAGGYIIGSTHDAEAAETLGKIAFQRGHA